MLLCSMIGLYLNIKIRQKSSLQKHGRKRLLEGLHEAGKVVEKIKKSLSFSNVEFRQTADKILPEFHNQLIDRTLRHSLGHQVQFR
jgi:hypothetical protein